MTTITDAVDEVMPGDIFFVDPFDIEVPEERTRHDPATDQAVLEMAMSFHTHGQRRPVVCRRQDDAKLVLDQGFIRMAAARLVRRGFKYFDSETKRQIEVKDRRFTLKVIIHDEPDLKSPENNVINGDYSHCPRKRRCNGRSSAARCYKSLQSTQTLE